MDNLYLAVSVVLPLLLMMSLGYLLKRLRLFDDSNLKVINNIVFRAFLPVLMFKNIYDADLSKSFNLKLIIFAAVSTLVIYIVTFIFVVLTEKDNRKRGVLIQGIFRSNFIIIGLPVSIALFGEESAGITSILIAVVIPMYNVLSVIALEVFRGGKINYKKIVKGIVTNPLIIVAILGIAALLSGVRFPEPVYDTVKDLAGITTPLALVALGGSFAFGKIRGYTKQIIIGLTGKLVVIPALGIAVSIWAGFRGPELVSLMAMFSAPTAVTSFAMAQQMDGDSDLAGHFVVLGSMLSVVTIFIIIFTLKQGGFI